MDSKEQRDWLEQMAHEVAKLLKDNHAERPDGDGELFQPMATIDVCAALDIDRRLLGPIKITMAELGYNISLNQHGIYLGRPGESITYVAFCVKMCRGMAEHAGEYLTALGRNNTLEEAKKMIQIELGCRLHEIPAWLNNMGVPMPKQLEEAWLALPSGAAT